VGCSASGNESRGIGVGRQYTLPLKKVEFALHKSPRSIVLFWSSPTFPGANITIRATGLWNVPLPPFHVTAHSKRLVLDVSAPRPGGFSSWPLLCLGLAPLFLSGPPAGPWNSRRLSDDHRFSRKSIFVSLPASRPVISFSLVPFHSRSSPLPTHDRIPNQKHKWPPPRTPQSHPFPVRGGNPQSSTRYTPPPFLTPMAME